MTTVTRTIAHVATMASLVIGGGCGSQPGAETSTNEVTVKGIVKLDGKPVTEGEIVFDPSNYQRQSPPKSAPIGKNGSYEVKTLAGLNTVRLGPGLLKKYPILQHRHKTFNAQDAENTFDFEADTK